MHKASQIRLIIASIIFLGVFAYLYCSGVPDLWKIHKQEHPLLADTKEEPLTSTATDPLLRKSGKEECEQVNLEVLFAGSDHVLPVEIFWSKKLNQCFLVTRRPVIGPVSGWATEYFQKNKHPNEFFIEVEYFTLRTYPDGKEELMETYLFNDLKEYLDNPNREKEWGKDFLKKIEQYR